jgi:hypothetical protein
MKEFIIYFIVSAAIYCLGFYVGLSYKTGSQLIPQPIKANITIIDGGVEVLNFDNSTLLPGLAGRVKFSCMDTTYTYTGKALIEYID